MDRRQFLRVLGATGGTAAVAGCRQSTEALLPHVVPNDQIVPGIPAFFATVCRECPAGCGVLARNNNGRVTKLEGNPDHPVSQGALCIRGHAALQGLYHPDRFDGPRWNGKPVSWDDAQKVLGDKLNATRSGGRGKAVALVSQLENGSLGTFLDAWIGALGARPRLAYEPFAYEAIRAANRATFGRDAIPYYAFEDAAVILSFGADFVETWLSNVEYSRNFARMHALRGGRAGTVIHVEPRQSLTASSADEWVRNAPGTEGLLALGILRAMLDENLADKSLATAAQGVDVARAAAETGVPAETIRHLAQAFANGKPSLAIGGGVAATGTNATQTMVAINLLNIAAGNVGKTVRFGQDSAYARAGRYADLAALAEAMANGQIEVLLLANGVNPVFTAPAGLKFAEAIKRVPLVVSFSNLPDETTALAHLVLPDTHWLENWGDYSPRDGVVGLMQPAMMPVRDSRPMADVLIAAGRAVVGGEEGKGPLPWKSFEEYVRKAWEPAVKAVGLERALQQGGIWREAAAAIASPARDPGVDPAPGKLEGEPSGFALLAYPSLRWFDGRGASRSWLQEAPDPMTQVTWDAWVEVPAEAAKKLEVQPGDMLRVKSPHGTIELPAYVSASLHPNAVAIPIGERHAPYQIGRYVAAAPIMNPMAVLGSTVDAASGGLAFLSVRVTLEKTGARRPLAVLQATHDQDHREIAQEIELRAARELDLRGKPPEHASHPSMYPDQIYPNYRWGMAIDLDACVGCAACMVACQAENNVPVVGKAQAAYGRQVHWIRIERWAEGAPSHPTNIFLPMLCQHCEVAPCEPVCPVFAAYRTDEGLNGQVYNRCVGTRYCGNNCPYHVRRFNWYQWEWPEPLDVQLNPDVTVRQLGVMEKCTMCLHRIIAGKDRARDASRAPGPGPTTAARGRVRDGEIQTACQQTCPTRAITFGDLKDGGSQVSKLSASPRGYHVLEELGTRSSITYLRKVVRGHAKGPEKGHG
jgi:anaerobic selenocysteine-containing dehydrogenase/Fe-S-cluster-containing dehydrogenase component